MIDRDVLGPRGKQQLLDHTVFRRFDLHGRLVGLDLGDDVAAPDPVAFLHMPSGERALLHGGREPRHEDWAAHVAPRRPGWWAMASSQCLPSNTATRVTLTWPSSRQRTLML